MGKEEEKKDRETRGEQRTSWLDKKTCINKHPFYTAHGIR
jgi:hypothetical protein